MSSVRNIIQIPSPTQIHCHWIKNMRKHVHIKCFPTTLPHYIPIKHVRCNPDVAPRLTSSGYEVKVDVITPTNKLFMGVANFDPS
jgi:hypothetical protein